VLPCAGSALGVRARRVLEGNCNSPLPPASNPFHPPCAVTVQSAPVQGATVRRRHGGFAGGRTWGSLAGSSPNPSSPRSMPPSPGAPCNPWGEGFGGRGGPEPHGGVVEAPLHVFREQGGVERDWEQARLLTTRGARDSPSSWSGAKDSGGGTLSLSKSGERQ